jgi:hypothetical protein
MVVSLSALHTGRAQPPPPQNHYFSASGTHFCYRLSIPQGLVRLEGLDKLKKFIHITGPRVRGLLACSIVPQSLRYRVLQNGFVQV